MAGCTDCMGVCREGQGEMSNGKSFAEQTLRQFFLSSRSKFSGSLGVFFDFFFFSFLTLPFDITGLPLAEHSG